MCQKCFALAEGNKSLLKAARLVDIAGKLE
jgi:hypothetical protein